MSSPFNTRKPASVTEVKEQTPEAKQAAENFSAERLIGMTFNMPVDWHRDFKTTAVIEGISMRELLFRSFEAYKRGK
jgi:hypothetical protein